MVFAIERLINPESEVGPGNSVPTKIPYEPNNSPDNTQEIRIANSIRLNDSEPSTDGFYAGYNIELTKIQANGKPYKQTKRIVAYKGSERLALIDDVWDQGFEPETGDSYRIVLAYPDMRVSNNTIMQVFDYICSTRYGRGLDPEKDFFLNTVINAAQKCDATSDVSIKLLNSATLTSGDVYKYAVGSDLLFLGTVRDSGPQKYALFTDVLGKITHKWFSWKEYKVNQIIYVDNRFYTVTQTGKFPTKPTHTSGTVNNLQVKTSLTLVKNSGVGPESLDVDLTKNPVLSLNEEGLEISGYTLYDADSISYWRLIGWDEHKQSSATLYQTNFRVDTSVPLFDNINMMTEHCNGIFSYSSGRYTFDVEQKEVDFVEINETDIIGRISLDDEGNRSSYNSVSVSYEDPANNFEGRNISLFSDKFLKQDRNVPKKGSITVSGMTNYYNVRLIADVYLKKSRFNSSISLKLFPEFFNLKSGSTISINYSRYRWTNKKFRVKSIKLNPDWTVNIVAKEYDDSFYNLTNLNKISAVGSRTGVNYTAIPAPTNMTASNNDIKDGILVTWDNAAGLDPATSLELQASDSPTQELVISNISSNLMTFTSSHNLKVGSVLVALTSGNGIQAGSSYFVNNIDDHNTLSVSDTLNGATKTLTNGSSLSIKTTPFSTITTVPYPENKYYHVFPGLNEQTTKYYRGRYRTQK